MYHIHQMLSPMTPKVRARKPKGQVPEAAGGSIWSGRRVTGEQEIDATAADRPSNRLPRVMFPTGRGLNADVEEYGRCEAADVCGHGPFADTDRLRTRTVRGHGLFADTTVRGYGLFADTDCSRPWTVHGHGLFTAMDCSRPWTVHGHGLATDTDWPRTRTRHRLTVAAGYESGTARTVCDLSATSSRTRKPTGW